MYTYMYIYICMYIHIYVYTYIICINCHYGDSCVCPLLWRLTFPFVQASTRHTFGYYNDPTLLPHWNDG